MAVHLQEKHANAIDRMYELAGLTDALLAPCSKGERSHLASMT
jgi:hypothetical protein